MLPHWQNKLVVRCTMLCISGTRPAVAKQCLAVNAKSVKAKDRRTRDLHRTTAALRKALSGSWPVWCPPLIVKITLEEWRARKVKICRLWGGENILKIFKPVNYLYGLLLIVK